MQTEQLMMYRVGQIKWHHLHFCL